MAHPTTAITAAFTIPSALVASNATRLKTTHAVQDKDSTPGGQFSCQEAVVKMFLVWANHRDWPDEQEVICPAPSVCPHCSRCPPQGEGLAPARAPGPPHIPH